MGLYAMGRTAAIAAIKAAVDARTTTLSDGSRSVDLGSLRQWLADQGSLIVSADVATANQAAATAVLGTIDANKDSQLIADYIGRDNWRSRADWPTALQASRSPAFISAVTTAMADMDYAVRAIEAVYEGVYASVAQVTDAAADEMALDAQLPRTVERIIDSRFYIATLVTDWGEESAPSPVSAMLELDQNDTVTLTFTSPPSGRNITKRRIYRSNTGSAGAAFQFVAEIPAATLSYTDSHAPAELGEVCPTTTWVEPPTGLSSIVGMPNGVMAGHYDNTVCFCEPYAPYAWPVEYQLTTQMPIVALGAFGQTLVVAHRGGIDYISGADAASMSMQKDVSQQTCVAQRSMVTVEGGVVFASPDGLCLATGNGVQLVTADHFTREDWQRLAPASMVAAYHERSYYFLWDNGTTKGCYALHLDSGRLTTLDLRGSALYVDPISDTLYAARGTSIYACFAAPTYRTATWRSKRFVLPQQAGFAWLTVESDFSAPVEVRWYGDGVLRHTATVASRAPVRLPAGRYLEHEIEVLSSARWSSLTIASSTAELQAA